LALSLSAAPSWATVIIDTDFSSASAGSITSNGAISGAGGLYGVANANDYLAIGSLNDSNALIFTKTSSTASNAPTASKTFSGASTGSTGDNLINGSFTLTRTNSVNGLLSFMINSGSGTTSSASVTAVGIAIRGSDGRVEYSTKSGTVYSSNLSLGSTYQFNISLDLSSASQDLWKLTILNLSSDSVFLDTGWVTTRAANVTPGILVWNGGTSTSSSTSSFVAVDNIHFDLVPEPSAFALVALGLGGLWVLRRRKRRAGIAA